MGDRLRLNDRRHHGFESNEMKNDVIISIWIWAQSSVVVNQQIKTLAGIVEVDGGTVGYCQKQPRTFVTVFHVRFKDISKWDKT